MGLRVRGRHRGRPRRPRRRWRRRVRRAPSTPSGGARPHVQVEVLIPDCKGDPAALGVDLRRPARRAEPQHRDRRPAAAGGPPVGVVRPQPGRAGPGQGRRAHHQVEPHRRHGRDRGRGGGDAGRPARRRRRHRHHRPVPAADHRTTCRSPAGGRPSEFDRAEGASARRWASATSRPARSPAPATTPARRRPTPEPLSASASSSRRRIEQTPMPSSSVHAERMARVRAAMADHGLDVVLLSVGPDLPWLTGYEAMPLERLTMLVAAGGRRRHAGRAPARGAAGGRASRRLLPPALGRDRRPDRRSWPSSPVAAGAGGHRRPHLGPLPGRPAGRSCPTPRSGERRRGHRAAAGA